MVYVFCLELHDCYFLLYNKFPSRNLVRREENDAMAKNNNFNIMFF